MKKSILVLLISFFVTASCSKSSDGGSGGGGGSTNCSGVPSSFSANVNPIIQSTCAINSGCHGSGSPNGPGELLTYTQIFNARITIKSSVANGTMPKNGTLTTAQKNSIICWVDAGGPNN